VRQHSSGLLEGSGFTGHGAIARTERAHGGGDRDADGQQRNYRQCAVATDFSARNSVIKRMIPKNPAAAKVSHIGKVGERQS